MEQKGTVRWLGRAPIVGAGIGASTTFYIILATHIGLPQPPINGLFELINLPTSLLGLPHDAADWLWEVIPVIVNALLGAAVGTVLRILFGFRKTE